MSDIGNPDNGPTGRVEKVSGVTDAERYLGQLCTRSFLSLWSYPSVFRDQSRKNGGDGKELCDLLIVFGNDVVIFSDKDCAFPNTGDAALDWSRWFRKSVLESAKQAWGAERWIRQHPDKLFVDRTCRRAFPLQMPDVSQARFHLVAVAHASSERCKQALGGSGSLRVRTDLRGKAHYEGDVLPFAVGDLDPEKRFVHVLDDTTLDIVLGALTTASDFIDYLTKKETLFRSAKIVHAEGEEDLLAFYLSDINEREEHDFIFPHGHPDQIVFHPGHWEDFSASEARAVQIDADQISYVWDRLIEHFTNHVLGGTSISTAPVSSQEVPLRWMAREGRTARRVLGFSLMEILEKTPNKPLFRATRVVRPPRPGSPQYVFLVLGPPPDKPESDYRKFRQFVLDLLCKGVRLHHPEATDIVGFATEPNGTGGRSEDIMYFDGRTWTPEMEQEVRVWNDKLGLFKTMKETARGTVYEYPTHPND